MKVNILIKQLLITIFLLSTFSTFAAVKPSLQISPMSQPAQVSAGSNTQFTYVIQNNSPIHNFKISFSNVNSNGLSMLSDSSCGATLAPQASCELILNYAAPNLNPGQTNYPFSQMIYVSDGTPYKYGYQVKTLVVPAATPEPSTAVNVNAYALGLPSSVSAITNVLLSNNASQQSYQYPLLAVGNLQLPTPLGKLATGIYAFTADPIVVSGTQYCATNTSFTINSATTLIINYQQCSAPPSLIVSTMQIGGDLAQLSPKQMVQVSLQDAAGIPVQLPKAINADNNPYPFAGLNPGLYYALPLTVAVGTDFYDLVTPGPYAIDAGHSNIILQYNKRAPTTVQTTVQLMGDLANTQQPVVITLTNDADSTSYAAPITADGKLHPFANVLPGIYSAAPISINIGAVQYNLTTAQHFLINAQKTMVPLNYMKAAPTTYPVSIFINGDLSQLVPVKNIPITLTDVNDQPVYAQKLITADGLNAYFYDNVLPGLYKIAQATYTDPDTGIIYKLLSVGPFTIDANQTLISLQYNKSTPLPPTTLTFSPYVDLTGPAPAAVENKNVTDWDANSESMQPTGLQPMITNSGIQSVNLAFIVNLNGAICTPSWGSFYQVPTPPFNAQSFAVDSLRNIQTNQATRPRLVISFGGLSNTYLEASCPDVASLVAAYQKVITAYNPDGLDFDFEQTPFINSANLPMAMTAIKQLQTLYPNLSISFTVRVMPTGLTAVDLQVPQAAHNILVNDQFSLNIMAMDYGDQSAGTMGDKAIMAAKNTLLQLTAMGATKVKVGIIPMLGWNDVIPENFSLYDADAVVTFAKNNSQINLLAMWSLNRDYPCTIDGYVSNSCSGVTGPGTGKPNQTVPYQYSAAFLKATAQH